MTRFGLWLRRTWHHWFPTKREDAYCSFCHASYKEAAPFAEGPAGAMICEECVAICAKLIADKKQRLEAAKQPEPSAATEPSTLS